MSLFDRKEEPKETFHYWGLVDHDPDLDDVYERVISLLGSVGCTREYVGALMGHRSIRLKFPESEPCMELLVTIIHGWCGVPAYFCVGVRNQDGKELCEFEFRLSAEETPHDDDPLYQAYSACTERLNAEEKRKKIEEAMALLDKAMEKP